MLLHGVLRPMDQNQMINAGPQNIAFYDAFLAMTAGGLTASVVSVNLSSLPTSTRPCLKILAYLVHRRIELRGQYYAGLGVKQLKDVLRDWLPWRAKNALWAATKAQFFLYLLPPYPNRWLHPRRCFP